MAKHAKEMQKTRPGDNTCKKHLGSEKKIGKKKQPISNGLQHWAKKPSLQPLLRRKNRQTGLPQIFGAQNMEHKVGWTCIKKILSQLHFLGWPRVPTESKGISLISSSAKGISPRSRLLQDFCTKVWGEERCKILCPAADRKKCFRIQKTSPKQIRRKNIPKRDPKSIYSWNQNMISCRNCAFPWCVFLSIKRIQKKIFRSISAGTTEPHLVTCHPWCEALKVAPLKTAIFCTWPTS